MSHVFGFLPKAKQEVITEFGLDKAYSTDKLISLDEDVVSRKQQMEKKAEEQEAEDEEMLKENNKKLNVKQKQEKNTQYQEEVA